MRRFSNNHWKAKLERQSTKSKTVYGNDPAKAMEHLRHFMISSTGSVLHAWIEFFDRDMDHRISRAEFSKGMRELGYKGDVFELFSVLDDDDSNELTLDEVDMKQATIWRNFRVFVAAKFKSEEELLQRCFDAAEGIKHREIQDHLSREDFCVGMRKCGWSFGVADLNWIFDALQDQSDRLLKIDALRWMGIELTRRQKKQEAKVRSRKWQALRGRTGASPQLKHRHFAKFKAFLQRKYGNLIRAWRQALSQTDSMVLSKLHFLKAAARLGFAKESKELWKALDKDDSGQASIDELDPKNAEILAQFKVWVTQKFGSVRAAFEAMDSDSTRFINAVKFANALKKFDFSRPSKQLFGHFDKDGDGKIVIEDVLFLENWNPLPFLVVPPNYKARNEIRRLILVRTGQYMKAWRRLLDKDATNRCNWYEFKDCCQVLGYQGDVPGAWRAFDDDLSGFISLKEIDEASALILSNFRKWALMEFGSIRSLFAVFDDDCSGSLSWQEFRYACNVYGYDGSIRSLFNALDVDQTGSLTLKEVVFLEDWDDDHEEATATVHEGASATGERQAEQTTPSATWQVTDRPARRFEVVRRKRDLELHAAPQIPRLRLSTTGDGEYSWSFAASRPRSQRAPRLRTRQKTLRSPFYSFQEEWSWSGDDSGIEKDLVLSERSSFGWSPECERPAKLIEKVGLEVQTSPITGRSTLGLSTLLTSHRSISDARPRPATVPTKTVENASVLKCTSSSRPLHPTLDQLIGTPRVTQALALEPARASAFQKCAAYYL